MGALALATENPTPALLLQKPNGRKEKLINGKMAKHICVQASWAWEGDVCGVAGAGKGRQGWAKGCEVVRALVLAASSLCALLCAGFTLHPLAGCMPSVR